jgi:hypothetical protein
MRPYADSPSMETQAKPSRHPSDPRRTLMGVEAKRPAATTSGSDRSAASSVRWS